MRRQAPATAQRQRPRISREALQAHLGGKIVATWFTQSDLAAAASLVGDPAACRPADRGTRAPTRSIYSSSRLTKYIGTIERVIDITLEPHAGLEGRTANMAGAADCRYLSRQNSRNENERKAVRLAFGEGRICEQRGPKPACQREARRAAFFNHVGLGGKKSRFVCTVAGAVHHCRGPVGMPTFGM